MKLGEIIFKFIAGGGLIVLISLLGKSKHPQITGLAVLFPAVTVVGYVFLSKSIGTSAIKPIILFSIYSIPTILVFLAALYLTIDKLGIALSVIFSITCWLIAAAIILLIDHQLFSLFTKGG